MTLSAITSLSLSPEAPLSIFWFRNDLRIYDNPALTEAAKKGPVLCLYIHDTVNPSDGHALGGASQVWLHHSLSALSHSLDGHLMVASGDPAEIFGHLVDTYTIEGIYWNRCYEPWAIERDIKLKQTLTDKGTEIHSFAASLLWEPWTITKADGTPYKVFTPFYRKGCLKSDSPREPLPRPTALDMVKIDDEYLMPVTEASLKSFNLCPQIEWDKGILDAWTIGEAGAHQVLDQFIETGLNNYKDGRNFPAQSHVSRLSPYLRWGEISPHTVWHRVRLQGENNDIDHFSSELGWREFSYYLLYHWPTLPTENFNPKFTHFPWRDKDTDPQYADLLNRWQRGQTGYPIVDAGMRELWQTGYMHNRVRMIVASFLIKNLLVHWRNGERWFWDCLVDADLANNSASWQWVAGTGADAAPYFRIFNPITQGQKFDPEGEYTRKYVPELAAMPKKYLYNPWEAPVDVREEADVVLGKTYPHPCVDLPASRKVALAAFAKLKELD